MKEIIEVTLPQLLQLQWLQAEFKKRSRSTSPMSQKEVENYMIGIVGQELTDRIGTLQAQGILVEFTLSSSPSEAELSELGYAGMLQRGLTPQEARDRLSGTLDEQAIAIIRGVAQTKEGKAFLERSAQQWRKDGVAPPWEGKL